MGMNQRNEDLQLRMFLDLIRTEAPVNLKEKMVPVF